MAMAFRPPPPRRSFVSSKPPYLMRVKAPIRSVHLLAQRQPVQMNTKKPVRRKGGCSSCSRR